MKLNIVVDGLRNDDASTSSILPDLREDALHALLTTFYEKVALDPLLAPYFAVVDMEHHMPRIVAFWETLVFDAGTYSGNAFKPHATMPGLTAEHFAHWLATMEQTVDASFRGPRADRMKFMAHRVAWSMQLRLGISPSFSFPSQILR